MPEALKNNKPPTETDQNCPPNCRGKILDWYDRHKRDLPWRDINDPYKTWLSEIMLQQTTVTAITPYYHKFLEKWPTIFDLANAAQDEVMHEWAGLGYYSRARNLHKCAQIIVSDYGGEFPQTQPELKKLPGIGDYTSSAILAIAFNKPATVMDGNIERIISRLYTIKNPLPAAKNEFREKTAHFFSPEDTRHGDMAQALMDIGATICTPKAPKCMICPANQYCAAFKNGNPEHYPVKSAKKSRPSKQAYAYWVENKGKILLERRPDTGILAETLGFPVSDWNAESLEHPAHFQNIRDTGHSIRHTFTHFDLELKLCTATIAKPAKTQKYYPPESNVFIGLPTLFSKVYKHFAKEV
jgi:A/G-specific adenine glycosylase